ncbi:hypothetical protein JXD38_01195 [candidate division WOR-3 bacterium]|nr:hypothetical protein [candidate division WOR-3 bacterium]
MATGNDRVLARNSAARNRPAKARVLLCAMVLGIGVSVGYGQWLEEVIYLPDSLSGVLWPSCIAANPDAHKVYISGTYDGRPRRGLDTYVIVVDAGTTQKVARIRVQEGVTSLCYNPVVRRLYASHDKAINGGISVIDGGSDSVICIIPDDSGPELLCCNTTNGKLYISSNQYDNSVAVYDCVGDSVIRTIPVPGFIWSLTFDSLGNRLYCGYSGDDCGLLVIDGGADSAVANISVPFTVRHAVVSHQHRRLYCSGLAGDSVVLMMVNTDRDSIEGAIPAGGGSLSINDVRDELYFCIPGDTLAALDCSGDTVARKLVPLAGVYFDCLPARDRLVCTAGGQVYLLDLADGSVAGGPAAGSGWLLLDRAECRLYTCSDVTVTVLDISTDSITQSETAIGSEPWVLCAAAKANKVYAGDMVRGAVYSLDCASGMVKEVHLPGREVRALCYDSLDNKLYCASTGARVHVIDCATDSVVAAVRTGSMPKQMAYDQRSNRVYVANTGSVTAIDCRLDSALRTVPLYGRPQYPVYNPERDEVLVPCPGDEAHYVAVVDCSTNTWVDTLMYATFVPIYCQSVGKMYMLSVSSSDIAVLDAATDSLSASIPGVKGCAGSVNETDSKVYAILPGLAPFIAVLDAKADTMTRVITSIFACSVTHDVLNDKVFVTGGTEPGKVFVLDGSTDSILDSIPAMGHLPYQAVWNPRDGRVYVANLYSGSISVFRDSLIPGIQDVAPVPRGHGSATIARQLSLPAGLRQADVYDISGRRVARLAPGQSVIGHLGEGIYFVRGPDTKNVRPHVPIRKVIITR